MGSDPTSASHLRLVWPQWQGAGTESIRSLAPEFPFEVARRGYSLGTKVLQAVLPEHDGPTAIVPVEMGDTGLEERDGIETKTVVLRQLRAALDIIQDHDPARITTLGGGELTGARGAHPHSAAGDGVDDLLDRAGGDDATAADHQEMVGGLGHLAHQV